MKTLATLLSLGTLLLTATGCQEKLGGGISSAITDGPPKASKTYVYGIRAGHELAFVIFSDIGSDAPGEAQAGSSWTGYIKHNEGPDIEYTGKPDGIDINGTEYAFTDGRIFLAGTKEGTVSVQQLVVPIGEGHYKEELALLENLEEVRSFLNN